MSSQQETVKLGEEPIFNLKNVPVGKSLLLGLQHAFAMFGATILVPLLTGLDVSTTLLMAGIGTLLFHLLTKGKVPAFLGSSFAFIAGYNAVTLGGPGSDSFVAENLPKACGGVFFAGLVYVVVAGLIKFFGVEKVMRFFPPVVTGPIIIGIGLILAPTAIQSASTDWLLAIIAIVVVVLCNIWGKGMIKIIPIMIGIVATYIIALILNRVDFASLEAVNVINMPLHKDQFMVLDISAIITILPISLATMMEHIGDISAISATTGKNYMSDPGLHRTLLGDGLATSLAAAVGGPANTTYGENTGVLVLTRVYAPRVMQIAAVMAIIASFFPAVSAVITSIPAAVIGGVSMILYGMISAIGVRNMVENKVDLTSSRNLIVAASILVTALGFEVTGGLEFTVGSAQIHLSGLAIAAIIGIVLNAILPGKDYTYTTEEPKDTGVDFSGVTDKK